jgi:hypothetical protein
MEEILVAGISDVIDSHFLDQFLEWEIVSLWLPVLVSKRNVANLLGISSSGFFKITKTNQ